MMFGQWFCRRSANDYGQRVVVWRANICTHQMLDKCSNRPQDNQTPGHQVPRTTEHPTDDVAMKTMATVTFPQFFRPLRSPFATTFGIFPSACWPFPLALF